MVSRAGERIPRDIQASARRAATCHTAVARPIAAVAIAVPRYPPDASRPRRAGSLDSGPPASLLTPTRASDTPSIAPNAPGPACSVAVRNDGRTLVASSCPASLKNEADPMLTTPGVSQGRDVSAPSSRSAGWSGESSLTWPVTGPSPAGAGVNRGSMAA